ncbi:MAG: hypothetical protein H0V44_11100 [Planctomycetes bacterium]|nr:hypothetical protein [Planctomycetota bacterium]
MALTISTISIRIAGRAAADITALEVDGVAVPIAADRSWSISLPAGPDARIVAMTATGPTRVITRAFTLRRSDAGAGAA